MTADEFVKALIDCAPSTQELQELGFEGGFLERWRNSYLPQLRIPSSPNANPVFDLVQRYDASVIEFTSVYFGETIEEFYHGLGFGWEEADPLVVSRETGEIIVEELGTKGFILWHCAKDASSFLDALAYFACATRLGIDKVQHESDAIASECGKRAGGEEYAEFFHYLVFINE